MEAIRRGRPVAVSAPRRGAQRRAELRPLRRAGAGATLLLASVLALLLAAALVGAAPASAGPPSASPPNLMALLAVEQAKLTAGDGAGGDWFGYSVALSGDTALVGAPYDTVGANYHQGSAYVFIRSGSSWSQQAQLTADDGAAWGDFGFSVALSGDTALVGAEFAGEAYVFIRSGSNWSQQAKWANGEPASSFGWSVAISGDTALVGAFSTVGGNAGQGSAYVYTRSGSSWSQQAQLTANDGAYMDELGSSVAISGETALVGARFDDIGGKVDQGSAYVFTRSGSSWSQQAKLTASDGAGNDSFGDRSVALSGETALVGARNSTVGGVAWQGAAYVFTRSGITWSQQAKLTAGSYQFGRSVALSGETALVGSGGGSIGQGSAYLFKRSGSNWSQPAPLTASDGAADDDFGYSVALSGQTALVGAIKNDVGGNSDQGSAYVFSTVQDSTAPVTTASGLQANASTGWINTPQTVTLTATDVGGSGVAATYYTIDGVQHTYSGAFVVSAEGSHTITYWSTDNAGNKEAHHSGYVNIDTTPPSGGFLINNGAATTTSTAVTGDSAVTDAHGPLELRFSVDGKSSWSAWAGYAATAALTLPPGAGSKTVYAQYRDAAGNTAELSDSIELTVVTPTLTLKLSGLKHGAITLGKRATAKGAVTPTSLSGSKLTLTVQKKKGSKWLKAKTAAATVSATGAYSWKYKPAKKGAYRMQATIAATSANSAATTKWLAFKVK